ncbi:MAG: protein translocase subunit SecF [Pseudomonadota bacterium]
MALLKFIPDQTNIPFTSWRLVATMISGIAILCSIAAVAILGLNFGVDFRGGVTVEVASDDPIDLTAVRSVVADLDLGDVRVQEIVDPGGAKGVVVFVEQQDADAETPAVPNAEEASVNAAQDAADTDEADNEGAQQRASEAVQAALRDLLGEEIRFNKIEVVGPTVSGELIQKGALAVALALGAMLIYIWARFEWQFSLGAVAALAHDIIITLGVFAVTQLEFNLPIIAAILTIVGYSMNDTVVVYDRVRENLRKFKKKALPEVADLSINDTLSRTVMTSVTTLIALVALYVIGGDVLRGFTFAMIWGILIGTYSSIFVAAPFLLATGVKRDWSQSTAKTTP